MTSATIPALGSTLLGMRATGLERCTVVAREPDRPRIIVEFADGTRLGYSGAGIADYTLPVR